MNQLLADERADIRVVKQVVDGSLKVLHAGLPGWDHRAVQQRFAARLVLRIKHLHRLQEVGRIVSAEVSAFAAKRKASKDLRELTNFVI